MGRALLRRVGSYGPGPYGPGPYGPPGALVGRALMALGPYGLGLMAIPWALVGWALMGPPGTCWAGP